MEAGINNMVLFFVVAFLGGFKCGAITMIFIERRERWKAAQSPHQP